MKAERDDLNTEYKTIPKRGSRKDKSKPVRRSRDKPSDDRQESTSGRSGVSGGKKTTPITLPQDTAELEILTPSNQSESRTVEPQTQGSVAVLERRSSKRRSSKEITLPCSPKLTFIVRCKDCHEPVDGVMPGIAGAEFGPTGNDGTVTGSVEANNQPQTPSVRIPQTEAWRYRADTAEVAPVALPPNAVETVVLSVVCLIQPIVEVKLVDNGVVGAPVANVPATFGGVDLEATDASGLAKLADGAQRFDEGDYGVTIAPRTREYFVAPDGEQPKNVDPFNVALTCAKKKFTYYVRRRAKPTVKVICHETTKPVPKVKVSLGDYNFGETGADGVARLQPNEWVDPATYKIALVLDDRSHSVRFEGETYPRFELLDPENPDRIIKDNDTSELLVKVHASGALVVEVFRYDGQKLKQRVKFDLTDGPTAKAGLETVDTPTNVDDTNQDQRLAPRKFDKGQWVVPDVPKRKIERDRLAMPQLRPGKYKVKLKDLAAIKIAEKSDPSSLEKWSIGPADNGEVAVEIKADKVSRVRFELTKVQKIQFIAFDIRPGTKRDPLVTDATHNFYNIYLGETNAEEDIGQRCVVMKNAIVKAKSKADPSEDVLKVFMAPEFYFRGTEGAYPVQKLDTIMSEMRGFTSDTAYKDWLFVFGTAIGYQRHSESYNEITKAEVATKLQLKVNAVAGSVVTVQDGPKDKAAICSRIIADVAAGYTWTAGGLLVKSARANATDPSMFDLELESAPAQVANDPIEIVEPIATEVYNYAMVQRGGVPGSIAGIREAVIYKETISPVDFAGIYYAKPDFATKRTVEIHGQVRSPLPIAGSTEALGQDPNPDASEFNESGLGGGSIFMAAGINFGLEVCRDHLLDRLGKYYGESKASPGEPMLQVLLVPSMGASLEGGDVPGVDGALMFNVDGGTGSVAGKRSGAEPYACPCHPTQKSSRRLTCTEVPSTREHYKCFSLSARKTCKHCGASKTDSIADTSGTKVCPMPHGYAATVVDCPDCGDKTVKLGQCATHSWGTPDTTNNCPTCNVAMTGIQAFCFGQHTAIKNVVACTEHGMPSGGSSVCPTTPHKFAATQLICPVCNTNNDIQGYCPVHNGWAAPNAGKCPTCLGSIAMVNLTAWCFTQHKLKCSDCATHPKDVPVDQKLYYCTKHNHYEATNIACSVCTLPTRKVSTPVPYVMAQNPPAKTGPEPVTDSPGTYSVVNFDSTKVVDGVTVTSQFEKVTKTVTPDQTKLFVGKGNINVYAVMDVPAAQTVQ